MIEIMTSVTLSLILMYSVARIYSRVGGTMNETTSIMETTNALRNARNRMTEDLEGLTVGEPTPTRNSRDNDGFFCYTEGLGAPIDRLYSNGSGGALNYAANPATFTTDCIALDSERYEAYGGGSVDISDNYGRTRRIYDMVDTTVGDTDDILSFTARAPADRPFRGRYIRPKYHANGYIYTGAPGVFESEYAEIVWFVRGGTLYRRVLPLMSNDELQDSLYAFRCAYKGGCDADGNANGSDPDNEIVALSGGVLTNARVNDLCNYGCGLFRFYDVSVHMDQNGKPVSNTLGDLTNRANRYGYWNPVGVGIVNAPNSNYGSLSIHGKYNDSVGNCNAWYWLRMPTLQESASFGFRAGAPFGEGQYARYAYTSSTDANLWNGASQVLTYTKNDGDAGALESGAHNANALPSASATSNEQLKPFIDFWNNPNIWDEVDLLTGDLNIAKDDANVCNQDVVLTNVLSFDVKAWDPHVNDYVDLGCALNNLGADPDDLRSGGYYLYSNFDNNNNPYNYFPLPCVYDTWTEQYQRDLFFANERSYANVPSADGQMSDIPLAGRVRTSSLQNYPPPYNVSIKSLKIELRVFDPRSKQVRNATFIVDLSKK